MKSAPQRAIKCVYIEFHCTPSPKVFTIPINIKREERLLNFRITFREERRHDLEFSWVALIWAHRKM